MAFLHRSPESVRAVFFSKKGPFVWAMGILMFSFVLLAIREIRAGHESFFAFFILFAALVFAWIALSTRYEIHEEDLVIRSGPQRWTIPLESIVEAMPASRWSPGPALSIDRLQLNYVKEPALLATIIVSPANQQEFLSTLAGAIREARDERPAPTWDDTHSSFRGRVTGKSAIVF